jgi:hypothetical protein
MFCPLKHLLGPIFELEENPMIVVSSPYSSPFSKACPRPVDSDVEVEAVSET